MDQYQGNDYPQPPAYQPSSSTFNREKTDDECKPSKAVLYMVFKFVPVIIYLIFKLFTDQYLSTFIIISILLSADFWVTKNIAGRHLAALRWYTKLDQNNQEKWCFQSSDSRKPSTCNALIFWLCQLLVIIFWLIITVINVITLSTFWVFLAIFCLVLLVCNFVFFLECKGEHQTKVNSLTKRMGVQFFDLNEQKAA